MPGAVCQPTTHIVTWINTHTINIRAYLRGVCCKQRTVCIEHSALIYYIQSCYGKQCRQDIRVFHILYHIEFVLHMCAVYMLSWSVYSLDTLSPGISSSSSMVTRMPSPTFGSIKYRNKKESREREDGKENEKTWRDGQHWMAWWVHIIMLHTITRLLCEKIKH